jgi:hypothetical protein
MLIILQKLLKSVFTFSVLPLGRDILKPFKKNACVLWAFAKTI